MLVVKVYVNRKLIDEVMVQQVGKRAYGFREYKIKKPEGVEAKILHLRKAGYKSLLAKVFALLSDLK